MENMTGLQLAAYASLCLKMEMIVKLLAWAAWVRGSSHLINASLFCLFRKLKTDLVLY